MIGRLQPGSARVALVAPAEGIELSYDDLHACVHTGARQWWTPRKQLAFLLVRNDLATVLALLSLREAGCAVALVDGALAPDLLDGLVQAYGPDLVVRSEPGIGEAVDLGGCTCWVTRTMPASPLDLHPLLGVLLATSGSTGSPKFVRLAESAVVSNARSIATALSITGSDRAITCLPLHYAYGLSILTSHLAAGATVVLSGHGVMAAEFWTTVREQSVTSLAGVPYTYEMLERLGLDRAIPACVHVMTQAGGKLSAAAVLRAHAFMHERGGRFHVMYGQTEATARIAVMPHEWLPQQVDAVGQVIPGGTLAACDEHGDELGSGHEGEIVYRGPNVMLGYATTRAELALGDVQQGVLRTGDLGRIDADGCLRITGRLKRMGKLFGVRVDLDVVERLAGADGPAAVLEGPDRLIVFAAGDESVDLGAIRSRIATRLRVQQRAVDVRRIAELPRTAAGKVDYPRLRAIA